MLNSTLRYRAGSNVSPDTLVLLALSDTAERSTLHQLIESWGYRVEQAESGESVLRAIGRAEPPAIVILEDSLPGLSGLALFHQIDRQSSRRRSWTIMLTSSEHAVAGTNDLPWRWAHVHDVVIQPVDKFELRVCLRAASRLRARYAELDDAMDAARFHASHDGLTGLWNREYLLKLLFEETDRTQRLGCPLSFMLLDLDHFSRINREHGYDGGDRVLRQLASRFRHCLRSYDITGRCGEDEFLIAMPGCTMEDTRSLAARLREFIASRPFDILRASVTLTASIGIAESGGRSPLVVLREAEKALVTAKLAGRNCVRYFNYRRAGAVSQAAVRHEGPQSREWNATPA